MEDLTRLDDRVRKLHGHFLTTQKDVDDILVSSEKLKRRGTRIEALDLETAGALPDAKTEPKAFDNRMGQLKLRVVDED
jgi:DNA recombination protein RmuC